MTSVVIPESVTSIDECAFYECTGLTDVYYAGSEEDWNEIHIGYNNDSLESAEIHYNTSGTPEPTEVPSDEPTETPEPTEVPSDEPTESTEPTEVPSDEPTESAEPTEVPSNEPTESAEPTEVPSDEPTESAEPTEVPSDEPTESAEPTESTEPTEVPSDEPTKSAEPTTTPTDEPVETTEPTTVPTDEPVETAEPNYAYTINDITLLSDGVAVSFTDNFGADAGILIVTVYDSDGRLTAVRFINISEIETDTADVQINTTDTGYISAFVWDDISTMTALSEKLTI